MTSSKVSDRARELAEAWHDDTCCMFNDSGKMCPYIAGQSTEIAALLDLLVEAKPWLSATLEAHPKDPYAVLGLTPLIEKIDKVLEEK